MTSIGVVKESGPGERRVAAVPAVVPRLVELGAEVLIEHDAGVGAHLSDSAYVEAGATAVDATGVEAADLLWCVGPPAPDRLHAGQVVVGLLNPLGDPARMSAYAERLAAAQAQHELAELADVLERRGVEVTYAIHPVAGRMPGHMNVLLAEANVPYPQLHEMDEANPEFARTDVALVIGANDVTNPAARRPGNPVSGMPILDVDHARSVIVIKRSMGHGYAGIDNELYTNPRTGMYFADAKKGLAALTAAVKTLVG